MRATKFDDVRRRLERELKAREGNMRQLARDVAGDDGSIETARRALYRILGDGQVPTLDTSRMLERGLGKQEGYFTVAKEARRDRRDRLAALEEEVAALTVALDASKRLSADLVQRVEALEENGVARGRRAGRAKSPERSTG